MSDSLAIMATDPAAFRSTLKVISHGRPVQFKPDPWQIEDFAAMDPAWKFVVGLTDDRPQIRRGWFERPKGHSKTSDLAIAVIWALYFSKRRIYGIVASGDEKQANILKKSINEILEANPWLMAREEHVTRQNRRRGDKFDTVKKKLRIDGLEVQNRIVRNTATGSEVEIISSDAKSAHGYTPDFVVVDELTNWPDNGEEFWTTLFGGVGKTEQCIMVVICNAGFTEHFAAKVKKDIEKIPSWKVSRLEGPCASWISQEMLDEQKAGLPPPVYERLWLNIWSRGMNDAIKPAEIFAAVKHTEGMRGDEAGWLFFGGMDLSYNKDIAALAVVGKHQYGRVRLAELHWWQAPRGATIDFEAIRQTLFMLHGKFRATWKFDPYQAGSIVQEAVRHAIYMEPVAFQGVAARVMASVLIDAFHSHNIELFVPPVPGMTYDDAVKEDGLIKDLLRLKIEERPGGWQLAAERTKEGHCDRATALALAMLAAHECQGIVEMPGQELIDAFRQTDAAEPHGQAAHAKQLMDYGMARRRNWGPSGGGDDEDDPESGWRNEGMMP